MNRTRRQVRRPAVRPTPQPAPVHAAPQCLHPDCHAHHAHPANRQVPAMPATPPAAPSRPWWTKITKTHVIIFLTVIIIGLGGSLNDDDHKIADLQQQVRHAQSTQGSKVADLDYAIKLCAKIAAKGDEAECITDTLAGH